MQPQFFIVRDGSGSKNSKEAGTTGPSAALDAAYHTTHLVDIFLFSQFTGDILSSGEEKILYA